MLIFMALALGLALILGAAAAGVLAHKRRQERSFPPVVELAHPGVLPRLTFKIAALTARESAVPEAEPEAPALPFSMFGVAPQPIEADGEVKATGTDAFVPPAVADNFVPPVAAAAPIASAAPVAPVDSAHLTPGGRSSSVIHDVYVPPVPVKAAQPVLDRSSTSTVKATTKRSWGTSKSSKIKATKIRKPATAAPDQTPGFVLTAAQASPAASPAAVLVTTPTVSVPEAVPASVAPVTVPAPVHAPVPVPVGAPASSPGSQSVYEVRKSPYAAPVVRGALISLPDDDDETDLPIAFRSAHPNAKPIVEAGDRAQAVRIAGADGRIRVGADGPVEFGPPAD